MIHRLGFKKFYIDLSIEIHGGRIVGGKMGDFSVFSSPLFVAQIQNRAGEAATIKSSEQWDTVSLSQSRKESEFVFSGYNGIPELCVMIQVRKERGCLIWKVKVLNDSPEWSVMRISYPMPVLGQENFEMFVPQFGGRIVRNAGKMPFSIHTTYPGTFTMQFFSVYTGTSGVYLGVEDGRGAVKDFWAKSENGTFSLSADFFAVGGGLAGNSFDAYGEARWQPFTGDWFDSAMIYADFVKKKAEWLPEFGRPDTAKCFRDIPFWLNDYIPNIPSQGENKPMLLSAGSDIYEPEHWYRAPIELQEQLGVPIACHVYNWHKIPFNIEYPHFLPAKDVFLKNAPELRKHNIYVMPYINAVSWESRDGEMGHEVNFENTGRHGSVILENGKTLRESYPQKTVSGFTSDLVQMCPEYQPWHNIMENLTREMERTLPIDGIYFDQIAATPAKPCYNHEHSHLPGGGAFWNEGYNRMMLRIRTKKPKNFFYFTESCAEPYMKNFDGYLTWNWVYPDDVPAFAAIYAGYIQMVGRVTDGKKKDDLGFFKYCNAKSLVYGQQLGWCKADILYKPEWMSFIKNAVRVRYELSELFCCGRMLRPPVAHCPLPKLVTEAGLSNKGNIESEMVIAGAWRDRRNGKTVIIAVNIADEPAPFTLTFNAVEYGIADRPLPQEFVLDGTICTVTGRLAKDEICVWKI